MWFGHITVNKNLNLKLV